MSVKLNGVFDNQSRAAFPSKKWVGLGLAGLTSTLQLVMLPHASATVVARAQGRCKLEQQYATGGAFLKLFDSHCNIMHKEGNGHSVVNVNLDSGQTYQFWGSIDNLSIQTNQGIYPARHRVVGDSEVFAWGERGDRLRLSVKTDAQYNPQVSHDTAEKVAGTVIGAVAGAFIGGLLSGGQSSSSGAASRPGGPTSQPTAGTTVSRLSDLIGVKGGSAEMSVRERGYRFAKASGSGDSVYSYWLERGTNYCVTIRTEQGRYQSIVYAGNPFDCQK
jgi:hypothetical protein